MTTEKLQKFLLLSTGFGLIPIALSYGVMPEKALTPFYGFAVDHPNLTHILRAVMGLYLAQALFWIGGAMKAELRKPALYGLVFFMFGVAAGRLLSLLVDGVSHWLLIVFFALEVLLGSAGWFLLRREE
ncbi:MAG: DUF4345 domain-containing protein [Bacteroidota bacterium]